MVYGKHHPRQRHLFLTDGLNMQIVFRQYLATLLMHSTNLGVAVVLRLLNLFVNLAVRVSTMVQLERYQLLIDGNYIQPETVLIIALYVPSRDLQVIELTSSHVSATFGHWQILFCPVSFFVSKLA